MIGMCRFCNSLCNKSDYIQIIRLIIEKQMIRKKKNWKYHLPKGGTQWRGDGLRHSYENGNWQFIYTVARTIKMQLWLPWLFQTNGKLIINSIIRMLDLHDDSLKKSSSNKDCCHLRIDHVQKLIHYDWHVSLLPFIMQHKWLFSNHQANHREPND